jgi:energy-coupling factor transporter ATP-binding protein EcfA2
LPPIIEVEQLWWRYSRDTEWVLRGIDLKVERGEAVAIVGPTGAGKTTLLACIQALLPHTFAQGDLRGSVRVDGVDTRSVRASQLAGTVGTVFEDAEAQFVLPTVQDDIIFGLESLGLLKAEMQARLQEVVQQFGLETLVDRNAHELSGGQKQRVALATILAMRPQVLMLDEPTAELDPAGKSEVLGIVAQLRQRHQLTIILVEQDLERLVSLVDRFVLLDEGRIVRVAPVHEFFMDPTALLAHGVNPPEVTRIFEPAVRAGHLDAQPLNVEEAYAAVAGKRRPSAV